MTISHSTNQSFFSRRGLLIVTLVLLFGLGFGIRLYQLTNLPLDFQPTRQLLSMLKARGMYDATNPPGIPDWQRQMAIQQWKTRADVEPSILENIVAFTYRFTGEHFSIARIYSSLFWIIGGIFLFLLVRDLISVDGAVIATAYYLFFPYAVIASRSFQPDPFMVMSIISFWWAFHRWTKNPSVELWALLAGLLGGLAILIKFSAAFFVIGAALGLGLGKFSLRDLIRKPQIYVMVAAWNFAGRCLSLRWTGVESFPSPAIRRTIISLVVIEPDQLYKLGIESRAGSGRRGDHVRIAGPVLRPRTKRKIFLYGLWGMYILYGLYFDYHIATHDYYQLPFIPIVAVSLAPLADWFLTRLAELSTGRWLRIAAIVFPCIRFVFSKLGSPRYTQVCGLSSASRHVGRDWRQAGTRLRCGGADSGLRPALELLGLAKCRNLAELRRH